jgi:hypothetical protein
MALIERKFHHDFTDFVSNTAFFAAVCGCAGFLLSHVVKHIDPKIAFVGTATGAAVWKLFDLSKFQHLKTATKIVGLASLIGLPYLVCNGMNLPVTFKFCILSGTIPFALALLEHHIVPRVEEALRRLFNK